jgi:hypothetical protein
MWGLRPAGRCSVSGLEFSPEIVDQIHDALLHTPDPNVKGGSGEKASASGRPNSSGSVLARASTEPTPFPKTRQITSLLLLTRVEND